jgi:hypothetical protein
MTTDGAYDGQSVYGAVAERHPAAAVVTPPRATSAADETTATARSTSPDDCQVWTDRLATSFRLQPTEFGRNSDVSLQGHHRPATPGPNSAQSSGRGKNRVQCAQPGDGASHPDLRPGE